MGGRSIEHEVSFNSGRTVCDHLDTSLYDVVPLYQTMSGSLYILPWRFLHRGKTTDFAHRLSGEAECIVWDDLKSRVDFVYIAVHGRFAEDGTLQGMLEVLDIPYLGSGIFSGALCMNKVMYRTFLEQHGINVPKGIGLEVSQIRQLKKNPEHITIILEKLKKHQVSLPYIVKPSQEGSSLGINAVFSNDNLLAALLEAGECDPRRLQDVLIEEKVEGMEFVCIIIQNADGSWKVLDVTEIVHEKGTHFFDYKQKYMPGRNSKITPARCSKKERELIKSVSLRTNEVSGFSTTSRIDGFLTKEGRVVVLDAQPITGMSPSTFLFDQAAESGMSHTELINYLIETDLHRYGFKRAGLKGSTVVNKDKKIRIGVLLGGDTLERETSLDSGRNVCYKLSSHKYEMTPLFVRDDMQLFKLSQKLLVKNKTDDIALLVSDKDAIKWSDIPDLFDFIFIGLHGGKGENGSVQGALDMLGVPYNGSGVLASSLCMDKYKTNDFLRNSGFHAPQSLLFSKFEWSKNKSLIIQKSAEEFLFPLIIKPHDDGCSMLVEKIHNKKELIGRIDSFFKGGKKIVMIEEWVKGVELTCGVLGNDNPKAFPPSEPILTQDILSIEEKFLPGAGGNQTPAQLPLEALSLVQQVVREVYKTIGCSGYARIDCFYQDASTSTDGKPRVVILEINTLPGLTPATCIFHQAAEVGLKPMEFIDTIVSLGLELFAENNREIKSHTPKELHKSSSIR